MSNGNDAMTPKDNPKDQPHFKVIPDPDGGGGKLVPNQDQPHFKVIPDPDGGGGKLVPNQDQPHFIDNNPNNLPLAAVSAQPENEIAVLLRDVWFKLGAAVDPDLQKQLIPAIKQLILDREVVAFEQGIETQKELADKYVVAVLEGLREKIDVYTARHDQPMVDEAKDLIDQAIKEAKE